MIGAKVTVGVTAGLLVDAQPDAGAQFGYPYPTSCIVKVDATAAQGIYLGGPGVTTANGYYLAPGEAIGADIVAGGGSSDVDDSLYAISTAPTTTYVLRRGN